MSSLVYSLRAHIRRMEPEKLWTYIITSVILFVIYIYLMTLRWEEPRFDLQKIAEIDFKKFEPPKPKAERKVADKPTETPKEVLEVVPETQSFEEIDMSKLTELTKSMQTVQDFSVLNRIAAAPNALPEVNVGTTSLPNFDIPVVASSDPNALPVAGAASNVYNPSLKTAKVGMGGVGGPTYSTGKLGPAADRTNTGGLANKITEKDIEEVKERTDFDKLFRELIEWMKKNQRPLPEVLKTHMRYRNGDLTSNTLIPGKPTYELFLLANEQSQDIGLLLVSKDDSARAILLRDRGFRKKSFSLHRGSAGLDDDAAREVMSLSMSEEDPTKNETSRFYIIFLNWWDEQKKGVK